MTYVYDLLCEKTTSTCEEHVMNYLVHIYILESHLYVHKQTENHYEM